MSHVYEEVPGDPAIRVCVTHNPEFGLYGDEECHADDPGYAAHAWRDIADMLAARLETHAPFGAGEEGEEDAAALRVYQAACRLADPAAQLNERMGEVAKAVKEMKRGEEEQ